MNTILKCTLASDVTALQDIESQWLISKTSRLGLP